MTDRHIAIETVIQPVVIYGTDVETVQIQGLLFETLRVLRVCTAVP